jgi:tmRNA-binding protein
LSFHFKNERVVIEIEEQRGKKGKDVRGKSREKGRRA